MFLKCKMDHLDYAANWKFLKDKYILGLLVQQEFGNIVFWSVLGGNW